MEILIFFIAHWYLSLFTQTFFHHRYSAHQMFTMSKFWERVFYVMVLIFQGSSFLSPRAYGILHRLHHAYADTEKDPHSPKWDKTLTNMMWKTKHIYNGILRNEIKVEKRFLKNLPKWDLGDKIGDFWPMRILWGAAYTVFYFNFATEWWMYLLLPIQYIMGPVHGAIINWFAHKYGYVSYKMPDTSKNLLPFDFLMLGESYHNNHHKFSSRPNFGVRWYEIDLAYPFIWLFNAVGIIKLAR